MRRIIIISAMLLGLFATSGIQKATAQSVSISYNTFYNELSPYGQWVDDPDYGKVWVCNERGFRPYSQGYWAYTDYGWTWVSDYRWGWAPFHYGRWKQTRRHGWIWVPGYEWAPAWVSWSSGSDYYGWAPLGPGQDFDMGMNSIPADEWRFVPRNHIADRSVNRYYVDNSRNTTIIQNTTIINNIQVNNNIRYHAGPQRAEVEQVTHKPIQTLAVRTATAPGKPMVANNQLRIYKPEVKAPTATQPVGNKTQPKLDPNPVRKPNPVVTPQPVQRGQQQPAPRVQQQPTPRVQQQPTSRVQQQPPQRVQQQPAPRVQQQPAQRMQQQPAPRVQQQPAPRVQQQPAPRVQQQPAPRPQPPVQNRQPQPVRQQPVQQQQPARPPVEHDAPPQKPQEQQPNREVAPEKKPPMG